MTAVVLRGDAARLPLPDESVDLVLCSPPYFGLRSYSDGGGHYDGQVGSEASPREYLAALAACTREWVRVLKPSGSIFVNLGDKYAGSVIGGQTTSGLRDQSYVPKLAGKRLDVDFGAARPKSLLGLPWRYALACVDDLGLILRRDIIWHKPNGLPESVTDRCRSSHEYLFHFTVRPRYFAAVDEIREGYAPGTAERYRSGYKPSSRGLAGATSSGVLLNVAAGDGGPDAVNPLGKLPGSVWSIPSAPLTVPASLGVDHFAAYPPELCRRIILGWSPPGICTACGEGRRPVTDRKLKPSRTGGAHGRQTRGLTDLERPNGTGGGIFASGTERFFGFYDTTITGYACACPQPDAPVRPALVVDPFGGTGTTALVAAAYGRTGVTVDRSADYCRLARWRTRDPAERARALGVPKPPPVPDGQGSLFDDEEAS